MRATAARDGAQGARKEERQPPNGNTPPERKRGHKSARGAPRPNKGQNTPHTFSNNTVTV